MFRKFFVVHNRTSLFLEISFLRAKTGRAGTKLLTGRAENFRPVDISNNEAQFVEYDWNTNKATNK